MHYFLKEKFPEEGGRHPASGLKGQVLTGSIMEKGKACEREYVACPQFKIDSKNELLTGLRMYQTKLTR